MSEPTKSLATTPQFPEPNDEADTGAEFKALWTDASEGRERLIALAKGAEDAGHPEIAKVYREISATVMSLVVDLTAATGGAIMNIEDEIENLPDPDAPDESTLLPEDAEKYMKLFEQYIRLFDGLAEVIPPGPEGEQQRGIFATLRRMTESMMEFTDSITIETEPETEPGSPEEEEEEEEEEPE